MSDGKIPDPEARAVEAAKHGFVDTEVVVLNKNGLWIANGQEITHEPTRRAFSKSLVRDAKGYFLHIGHDTKRIQVEDTAYFVERIEGDSASGYRLFLSDETTESLTPATLNYRPGRLTCRIKNGAEEAKFLQKPYMEILQGLEESDSEYFLTVQGRHISLGKK